MYIYLRFPRGNANVYKCIYRCVCVGKYINTHLCVGSVGIYTRLRGPMYGRVRNANSIATGKRPDLGLTSMLRMTNYQLPKPLYISSGSQARWRAGKNRTELTGVLFFRWGVMSRGIMDASNSFARLSGSILNVM